MDRKNFFRKCRLPMRICNFLNTKEFAKNTKGNVLILVFCILFLFRFLEKVFPVHKSICLINTVLLIPILQYGYQKNCIDQTNAFIDRKTFSQEQNRRKNAK